MRAHRLGTVLARTHTHTHTQGLTLLFEVPLAEWEIMYWTVGAPSSHRSHPPTLVWQFENLFQAPQVQTGRTDGTHTQLSCWSTPRQCAVGQHIGIFEGLGVNSLDVSNTWNLEKFPISLSLACVGGVLCSIKLDTSWSSARFRSLCKVEAVYSFTFFVLHSDLNLFNYSQAITPAVCIWHKHQTIQILPSCDVLRRYKNRYIKKRQDHIPFRFGSTSLLYVVVWGF